MEKIKIGDCVRVDNNLDDSFFYGVVVGFKQTGFEDVLSVKTFSLNGWQKISINVSSAKKIKPLKTSNVRKKYYNLIKNINKKVFTLREEFTVVDVDSGKLTIPKDTVLFVDFEEKFFEKELWEKVKGFDASQLFVFFNKQGSVFLHVKCFWKEKDRYVFIPLKKLKEYKWKKNLFQQLFLKDKNVLLDYLVRSLRNNIGRTLLFYGDVGSGKGFAVKALTHKLKKPLFNINFVDIQQTSYIDDVFELARKYDGVVSVDNIEMFLNDKINANSFIFIKSFVDNLEKFNSLTFFCSNGKDDVFSLLNDYFDKKIFFKMDGFSRKKLWNSLLPKSWKKKIDVNEIVNYKLNGIDIKKIISELIIDEKEKNLQDKLIEKIQDRIKEKEVFNERFFEKKPYIR